VGATLTVRIAADINSFSKNLTKVEKDFVRAAKRIETVGKDLSLAVTAPLLALGGAFAKAAADDAASVDRLKRVFGGAATEMEGFIKQVMKTIPVTDDALRELTGTTQNFLTQLGIAPKAAVGMTETLTKLAGDMAAFNHVDVGTALDALEKGLAGKTKGLTSLGVVISEQMIKQEAYRLGLAKTGEELSQSATAHAALALIMQKTSLQQGEAARTAGEANKSWAFLKQGLDNLADSMGSALIPALSGTIRKATDVANAIAQLPTSTRNLIIGIAGVAAVVGPATYALGAFAESVVRLGAAMRLLGGAGGIAAFLGTFSALAALLAAIVVPFMVYNKLMEDSASTAGRAATDIDKLTASLYRLSKAQLIQKRLDVDAQLRAALTDKANLGSAARSANGLLQGNVSGSIYGETDTMTRPSAAARALDAKIKDLQAQGDAIGNVFEQLSVDIPGAGGGDVGAAGESAKAAAAALQASETYWHGQHELWMQATEKVKELQELGRQYLLDNPVSKLFPVDIPDVSMPSININDSLTKDQIKAQDKLGVHLSSNADKNANLLKNTIESTTANLASVLVSALNIGGGGRASQIGGAFGGAIGFGVGTFAGAKMGGLLGSIVPGVGTIVGSLIGSAIGGLFGHHKKSVDQNTEAIKALTQAMQQNAPSGFKIDAYRYGAAPATHIGRRPGTGAPNYNLTIQGDVHVHDVADPESFWDAMMGKSSSIRSRGGVSQLAIASGSFQ
jgi:hypothetical protein